MRPAGDPGRPDGAVVLRGICTASPSSASSAASQAAKIESWPASVLAVAARFFATNLTPSLGLLNGVQKALYASSSFLLTSASPESGSSRTTLRLLLASSTSSPGTSLKKTSSLWSLPSFWK